MTVRVTYASGLVLVHSDVDPETVDLSQAERDEFGIVGIEYGGA